MMRTLVAHGLALVMGASAAACASQDFARVVILGPDRDFSSVPVDIDVRMSSSGTSSTFTYTSVFPDRSGGGNVPSTSFAVVLDDKLRGEVNVAAAARLPTRVWGSDARIELPARGRDVTLTLSPGELFLSDTRIAGASAGAVALFGPGFIAAWPDATGVSIRIERDSDRLAARSILVGTDPNATGVRIASRPTGLADGADLAAVAWLETGQAQLRTYERTASGAQVTLGNATDAVVTCLPRMAQYDVATLLIDRGILRAAFHDTTGARQTPTLVLGDTNPADPARSLVGAVAGAADDVLVGVRRDSASFVFRFDPSGLVGVREVGGDLRAVARAVDGRTLLVARTDPNGGNLVVEPWSVEPLGPSGPGVVVAPLNRLPADRAVAPVALSSCMIVWPELREDGTEQVDLRYVYLDETAQPVGRPRLAHVDLSRSALLPSVACASPTRAFVSFARAESLTAPRAELRVRRMAPPE
jgi:hypothetical protein